MYGLNSRACAHPFHLALNGCAYPMDVYHLFPSLFLNNKNGETLYTHSISYRDTFRAVISYFFYSSPLVYVPNETHDETPCFFCLPDVSGVICKMHFRVQFSHKLCRGVFWTNTTVLAPWTDYFPLLVTIQSNGWMPEKDFSSEKCNCSILLLFTWHPSMVRIKPSYRSPFLALGSPSSYALLRASNDLCR